MPRFHVISTSLSMTFAQFSDWFKSYDPKDSISLITNLNWKLYDSAGNSDRRVALTSMARAVGLALGGVPRSTARFSNQLAEQGIANFFGVSQVPYLPTDPLRNEKSQVASSFESFHFQDGSAQMAIYRYHLLYSHPSTKEMRQFDFTPILGMRFDSFFTIWLSLFALAHNTFGVFSLPLQVEDRKMKRHFNRRQLDDRTIQQFVQAHSTTIDNLSNFERPIDQNAVKMRYDPNPLLTCPIIDLDGVMHLIPSPESFLNILGNGIYYKAFSRQSRGKILGDEFEVYVANQFSELKQLPIHRIATSNADSRADWILLFKDFTLIVEAKSQRLSANARGGGSELVSQINKFLDKGVKQINETKKAIIEQGDQTFSFVPRNKPIFGLIVLLEPFYLANSVGLALIPTSPLIPLAVISARELENICALSKKDEAGDLLRAYIEENSTSPQIFTEWARNNQMESRPNRLVNLAEIAAPWAPYGGLKSRVARQKLAFILKRKAWYESS